MKILFEKFKHNIYFSGKMGLFWLLVHIFFLAVGVVGLMITQFEHLSFGETLVVAGANMVSLPLSFPLVPLLILPGIFRMPFSPLLLRLLSISMWGIYYGLYSVILLTKNPRTKVFLWSNVVFAALFVINITISLFLLYNFRT